MKKRILAFILSVLTIFSTCFLPSAFAAEVLPSDIHFVAGGDTEDGPYAKGEGYVVEADETSITVYIWIQGLTDEDDLGAYDLSIGFDAEKLVVTDFYGKVGSGKKAYLYSAEYFSTPTYSPLDVNPLHLVGYNFETENQYWDSDWGLNDDAWVCIDFDFVGDWEGITEIGLSAALVKRSINREIIACEDTSFTVQRGEVSGPFNITTAVSPTGGGTVTGGGTFAAGKKATLSATAADGYYFKEWQKNGTSVSTEKELTVTATEDATYTAVFEKYLKVTFAASPAAGGTVECKDDYQGKYQSGQTARLSATAATGYSLDGWYVNGAKVGNQTTYRFTVTEDTHVEARFKANTFTVAVSATPTEGGTVTGGGTLNQNSTATLVATPNEGYNFVKWTDKEGATVSSDATFSFTVEGDVEYVAVFEKKVYTVTVTSDENGTAIGGGSFEHGLTATLVATPNEGYSFVGWFKGGALVSTEKSYTFTVTEAADYTASFSINKYTVKVNSAYGVVEGAGVYDHGATVTLTVVSTNEGFKFISWKKSGTTVSTESTYTFTATENVTITAFYEIKTYNVTTTAQPGGQAAGAGNYNHGTTVTLTATALEGYNFLGWFDGETLVNSNSSFSFTAKGNVHYTAKFSPKQYTIVIDPANGSASENVLAFHNSKLEVPAVPSRVGYTFAGWYVGGTEYDFNNDVTGPFTLTAKWTLNSYNVTVTGTHTTVEGNGEYEYGASATLTATPEDGYHFIGWFDEGGNCVSENQSYTFTVEGNVQFSAVSEINVYTIGATAGGNGSVAGAGNYNHGTQVTLIATPDVGYHFVKWTKGGVEVSTSATFTFNASESADYKAEFAINTYDVIFDSKGGSAVLPQNGVEHGQLAYAPSAPTKEGYDFVGWTLNGVEYDFSTPVTETITLVANWTKKILTVTYVLDDNTPYYTATLEYGTAASFTKPTDPTKIGYTFDKWTLNGADFAFTALVTESITLKANFNINKYTVSFDSNGGSAVESQEVEYGKTANVPTPPPVQSGYYFEAWLLDGVKFDFSTPITEPIVLTAKWSSNPSVSFDSNGGSAVEDKTVIYGEPVAEPAVPTRTGYRFLGWYIGDVQYDFSTSVTTSITLTAKWEALYYSINFNVQGNGWVDNLDGLYAYNNQVTLNAYANEGSYFVEWQKNGVFFSDDASVEIVVDGEATFTAVFTKYIYNISVDVIGTGTVAGAGAYEYNEDFELVATPGEGYRFVGWYYGAALIDTLSTFRAAAVENITLTAVFEISKYQIDLQTEGEGTAVGGGLYTHGTSATL
ncbi:MAG: InlB B-repeat-containing protein, partial [Clostridia bacterium]|nr:InlB B-repeat-containing protein [Clostridia bacterium]